MPMFAVDSPNLKPLVYTDKALERAERSLLCSPFNHDQSKHPTRIYSHGKRGQTELY
jgi:hypothetical protein